MDYRNRAAWWSGSLLLLSVAACSNPPDTSWAGTFEQLPNGAVRVTNPPGGLWQEEDAWRLQPEFAIGKVEGEGADVFGSISALEVDQIGNIYVLDRQANDLRIFDEHGNHVRTVGRAGQGPGEYSAANGLVWLAEDSLLVIDQRGDRYSVLDQAGNYVRAVRRRLGFYGWVFQGGMDGDLLYEISSIRNGEEYEPALLGTRVRGDGLEAGSAPVPTDQPPEEGPRFVADTLRLPKLDGPLFESFSVRNERGGMVMGVPFAGTPQYNLDGSGGIWMGHSGTPRLYHVTLKGDTLAEVILSAEPAAVSPEEVDEWQAQPAIEQFKQMGGKLDLSRIPKTKPFFNGIIEDGEEYLWLTVPTLPQRVEFAVLDPDGRYLGHLDVDGIALETYVRPVVRNDRLYFVGRDDLDVQRVYVYRIIGSRTRTAQTTAANQR
jgi:6-bladed beta-propeller